MGIGIGCMIDGGLRRWDEKWGVGLWVGEGVYSCGFSFLYFYFLIIVKLYILAKYKNDNLYSVKTNFTCAKSKNSIKCKICSIIVASFFYIFLFNVMNELQLKKT